MFYCERPKRLQRGTEIAAGSHWVAKVNSDNQQQPVLSKKIN